MLHNEGRIEGLFFLYFLALLVQGLVERELRRVMLREGIEELPLYPEARCCRQPTAEQIMNLFSLAQRGILKRSGSVYEVFEPQFTPLQQQVLGLLGVPADAYRGAK